MLGCGAGAILVMLFGVIPMLIMEERQYRRRERGMIAVMDFRVRETCKQSGLSKKYAAKIIADRNKSMKLPRR